MASSDLLLQSLLGGQQATDPAVAAFQPKMQLAQAMLQQGMDSSPTTKWGGLSRLASALTGGYLMDQNQTGLQDIANKRAQDAASFGASLGDTLTPPSAPAQTTTQAPAPQANQPGMNVAPTLAAAVHQNESGGSMAPGITGDNGAAAGPMQVHQAALDDVNKANGTNYTFAQMSADPSIGKAVGDSYLKLQQARFPGRPDLALAAYNAGPTATANAGGPGVAGVPQAAQGYVDKGMAQVVGPGAPQQVTQAPPSGQSPQVGADNPYVAKALDTIHRAQAAMIANPYNPQIQKAGQMAIDNAHTMMEMDQFVTNLNGTQTNLRTGQVANAPTITPHYSESSPGVYTTPGGTDKPVFAPAGRIAFNPATSEAVVTGPGGAKVFQPPDLDAAAALKSAQAQGTKTGEQAAATVPKMAAIGSEADTAIGNIDYGMNQLHQAAAGGINSGYFAPWVATAAAAGKSLGIDTKSMGVDPTAVGNVQSAQKTLGVVAGAILQNAIGKDSAITDAKIEHFIHTQPGIETDPEAIQRVLGWARSQFVYNRNMAMDAVNNSDPHTGMISPGWQAQFYKKQGAFAPIYDPLSQEMKQPAGEGPAASMPSASPAPQQAAPAAPTSFREGQVATHPDGRKAVFSGGKWVVQ